MTRSTYKCNFCGAENKYKGVQYANKYCNSVCKGNHQKQLHKEAWLAGTLTKQPDRSLLRRYLTEEHGYKCSECGTSEWQEKEITLQVDHKDGNAGNNAPDNLRLLCPNCHSQQPNWGARNKGKGRATRGLPLY